LASIVGQQATLRSRDELDVRERVVLMRDLAMQPRSILDNLDGTTNDLIVKGIYDGQPFGGYMANVSLDPDIVRYRFVFDRVEMPTEATLNQMLNWFDLEGEFGPFTFTAVPPGSGRRMGVDRDRDGLLDAQDSCPGDALCPSLLDGEVMLPNLGGVPAGPQDENLKKFGMQ